MKWDKGMKKSKKMDTRPMAVGRVPVIKKEADPSDEVIITQNGKI